MGLTVEGLNYSFSEFGERFQSHTIYGSSASFIVNWLNNIDFFTVTTSGSTGPPSEIKISRNQMKSSAIFTGEYFGLKPDMTMLLAFDSKFIAGKMILVRGMELDLNIVMVQPGSTPLQGITQTLDFVPLVPFQLSRMLAQSMEVQINNCRCILLGGAPVSGVLEQQIRNLAVPVFHSFGMTETVSHVAIRKIDMSDNQEYHSIGDVEFSTQSNGCLTITGSVTGHQEIESNDVVKLISNKSFIWLGRIDNVINTGGIKINPEIIENKLAYIIQNELFISSKPDNHLGEKIVLIVEGTTRNLDHCFDSLEKYEKPREVYFLEKFVRTKSGKINRRESEKLLT